MVIADARQGGAVVEMEGQMPVWRGQETFLDDGECCTACGLDSRKVCMLCEWNPTIHAKSTPYKDG